MLYATGSGSIPTALGSCYLRWCDQLIDTGSDRSSGVVGIGYTRSIVNEVDKEGKDAMRRLRIVLPIIILSVILCAGCVKMDTDKKSDLPRLIENRVLTKTRNTSSLKGLCVFCRLH